MVIDGRPSVLVAIASYGTAQDRYLERVVAEYGRLPMTCRVVVLSDRPKSAYGAEVLVGLPSRNPYSLPFAHRRLFAEHVDRYGLFIYSEDDTLITASHVAAYLDVQRHLNDDEIVGFMRSEVGPGGEKYITSANCHFRWLADSIQRKAGHAFARFSNLHSGCFIANQAQLRRAIASGGFLVEPHDEMYGMLESAASDIYRQCGLTRVICLSRVHDFIVPHLPNKYVGRMGILVEELELQIETLLNLPDVDGWRLPLFEPETRAPGFRWSRNLYAMPAESFIRRIPASARRILSVAATFGSLEKRLAEAGADIQTIAFDPVFAAGLRRRGFKTVVGPLPQACASLADQAFDAVLMPDVLHLVDDPATWLGAVRRLLSPGGQLVASVPNTGEVASWVQDLWNGRVRHRQPDYAASGAHPASPRRLRRWLNTAGFEALDVAAASDGASLRRAALSQGPFGWLFAPRLVFTARRPAETKES